MIHMICTHVNRTLPLLRVLAQVVPEPTAAQVRAKKPGLQQEPLEKAMYVCISLSLSLSLYIYIYIYTCIYIYIYIYICTS